jgi:hypothetical protein
MDETTVGHKLHSNAPYQIISTTKALKKYEKIYVENIKVQMAVAKEAIW